jgi:CRP-like cAMP-binding protein/nucleotide-binding universal stress UspA family protein
MYRKILVPLDGSGEAEKVVPLVEKILTPNGEAILFRVFPPLATVTVGGATVYASQREEEERVKMTAYLQGIVQRIGQPSLRHRCEVVGSKSVAEAITDFATKEDVDLIAMYTHDRKGLVRLIRGSIAEKVQRRAPIEVQVFKPTEVVGAVTAEPPGEDELSPEMQIMKEVDVFTGLSDEQIQSIASLAKRSNVAAGEVLGRAGETGDSLFIVIQGEARLSAYSAAGEITVRIAGPGQSYSLAALIGAGTLVTSGKALTDMDLLTIPASALTELCTRSPEIGVQIYKNIAAELVNRYGKTLAHLTLSEDRALEASIEGR